MDASSWLVNSDSSNQSDVLRAVLTVLQQNNPDLKGLALANPGGEFYNVNEAKIRKLKDLYFNYKPPIYTKRDIHGLNQAYAKYQHSIHQARVQTVARDNILRGEQLLSSPAASDILNPQISNLCLESGQCLETSSISLILWIVLIVLIICPAGCQDSELLLKAKMFLGSVS